MPDDTGEQLRKEDVTGEEWRPVRAFQADTGMRWGLDEDEFRRWYHAVPFEDQQSFKVHRGNERLARFVCVLDWLIYKKGGQPSSGTIVEAYAIATRADPYAVETQMRATKAWDHDAVKDFMSRLASRGTVQARNRVMLKYTALLEGMLGQVETDKEASVEDKARVANSVSRFIGIVSREELFDKNLRSKKSVAAALENIEKESDFDVPSDVEFEKFVTNLTRHFGKDRLIALVERQKSLPDATPDE